MKTEPACLDNRTACLPEAAQEASSITSRFDGVTGELDLSLIVKLLPQNAQVALLNHPDLKEVD